VFEIWEGGAGWGKRDIKPARYTIKKFEVLISFICWGLILACRITFAIYFGVYLVVSPNLFDLKNW